MRLTHLHAAFGTSIDHIFWTIFVVANHELPPSPALTTYSQSSGAVSPSVSSTRADGGTAESESN